VPGSAQIRLRRPSPLQEGMRLFKQRQIDAAIEQFNLAIQANPNEVDAYRYLGAAYGQKNLWAEASQMLQMVIHHRPDDLQSFKNLGMAYLKQNLLPRLRKRSSRHQR